MKINNAMEIYTIFALSFLFVTILGSNNEKRLMVELSTNEPEENFIIKHFKLYYGNIVYTPRNKSIENSVFSTDFPFKFIAESRFQTLIKGEFDIYHVNSGEIINYIIFERQYMGESIFKINNYNSTYRCYSTNSKNENDKGDLLIPEPGILEISCYQRIYKNTLLEEKPNVNLMSSNNSNFPLYTNVNLMSSNNSNFPLYTNVNLMSSNNSNFLIYIN
jgi:hypothetical protein